MFEHEKVLVKASVYQMLVRSIRIAWKYLYDEEMEISGDSSAAQFQSCMVQVTEKLHISGERTKWARYLDVGISPDGVIPIERITDVDDLTPNMFKYAVYEVAERLGKTGASVEVKLTVLLKRCLVKVFKDNELEGKMNIGANRHFPRLFQWLKEVQDETDWPGGKGLRIMNASGAGAVAAHPVDPAKLKVVIKKDWL